jgi:hypothetical protein
MIVEQFNLPAILNGTSGWMGDAACAGQYELYDTAAQLPVLASAQRVALRARALEAVHSICSTCPVLRACETASMTEDRGYWAGMTEQERATRFYAIRALTTTDDEDQESA